MGKGPESWGAMFSNQASSLYGSPYLWGRLLLGLVVVLSLAMRTVIPLALAKYQKVRKALVAHRKIK